MELDNSIDERNKELYEKLIGAGVDISFIINNTAQTWYVREKLTFEIGSPDGSPNPAAMAHELLHIQLIFRGFGTTFDVYKHFNENNSLFTPEFIGELNNNLAHFKMIDDFQRLGFNIDDFLQDTPKTYYLKGMLFQTMKMVTLHKAGITKVCEDVREIVLLCASAKLFELYKLKDPETKNGLHPDGIINPLKEINRELVDGLVRLFDEWNEANTVDSIEFFARLNNLLKEHNIPIAADC